MKPRSAAWLHRPQSAGQRSKIQNTATDLQHRRKRNKLSNGLVKDQTLNWQVEMGSKCLHHKMKLCFSHRTFSTRPNHFNNVMMHEAEGERGQRSLALRRHDCETKFQSGINSWTAVSFLLWRFSGPESELKKFNKREKIRLFSWASLHLL